MNTTPQPPIGHTFSGKESNDFRTLFPSFVRGQVPDFARQYIATTFPFLHLTVDEAQFLADMSDERGSEAQGKVAMGFGLTTCLLVARFLSFALVAGILITGIMEVFPRVVAPFIAVASLVFAWVSTRPTWGWIERSLKALCPSTRWPSFYDLDAGNKESAMWMKIGLFLREVSWLEFQAMRKKH